MNEALMLDVVFGAIFACGLLYCFLSSRKLSKMYKDKDSLENLLRELSEAKEKNCAQIEQLETQLRGLYERWEDALNKGDVLRRDLDYFISRGESLLKDMEPKVRELRSLAQSNLEEGGREKVTNVSILNPQKMNIQNALIKKRLVS